MRFWWPVIVRGVRVGVGSNASWGSSFSEKPALLEAGFKQLPRNPSLPRRRWGMRAAAGGRNVPAKHAHSQPAVSSLWEQS